MNITARQLAQLYVLAGHAGREVMAVYASDFAVQTKGSSLLSTLDKWHAKADGRCAVDYGFHMIVSDVNDTSLNAPSMSYAAASSS